MTKLDGKEIVCISLDGVLFHGNAKIIFQTFHSKENMTVFGNKFWRPTEYICLEEKSDILKIKTSAGRTLLISKDGYLSFNGTPKKVSDLFVGDEIQALLLPFNEESKIVNDVIISIDKFEQSSGYLFGFIPKDCNQYALYNGIIIYNVERNEANESH